MVGGGGGEMETKYISTVPKMMHMVGGFYLDITLITIPTISPFKGHSFRRYCVACLIKLPFRASTSVTLSIAKTGCLTTTSNESLGSEKAVMNASEKQTNPLLSCIGIVALNNQICFYVRKVLNQRRFCQCFTAAAMMWT